MNDLIETISNSLDVPCRMLSDALSRSRKQVRHIRIPKKDGSYRRVYQPSKKLKVIQYWLMHNVLNQLRVHNSATGFQEGKSIRTNALVHRKGRYFLKLDFKDFFPSIKFNDFKPLILGWHETAGCRLAQEGLLEVIRLSCFYEGDSLPIGYPTSPMISNAVMYRFDSLIIATLTSKKEVLGNVVYTRYADDMTFSTTMKGVCGLIEKSVEEIISSMDSPRLSINASKTRFVSSSGGSAIVTGLRICHDGHITVHRNYKDKVRLLLSLFEKGSLNKDDIPSLKGHLAYIKHVDSKFYTRLQSKYFKSIKFLFSV